MSSLFACRYVPYCGSFHQRWTSDSGSPSCRAAALWPSTTARPTALALRRGGYVRRVAMKCLDQVRESGTGRCRDGAIRDRLDPLGTESSHDHLILGREDGIVVTLGVNQSHGVTEYTLVPAFLDGRRDGGR